MEIRQGRENDFAQAMELVAAFAEESLHEYGVHLEIDQLQKTFDEVYFSSFVAVEDGKVVGVLAGHLIPDRCSDELTYEEVVWYMSKEHRKYGIKLFNYVQQWCVVHGIQRISMSCMHNSKTEKLFALYEKMGFKPMETRFIKVLD